jgi:hypothetical protein
MSQTLEDYLLVSLGIGYQSLDQPALGARDLADRAQPYAGFMTPSSQPLQLGFDRVDLVA